MAVIAIVLVRPAAMLLSLLRTPLPPWEHTAAARFGPNGVASVVCVPLAVQAGMPAWLGWAVVWFDGGWDSPGAAVTALLVLLPTGRATASLVMTTHGG
ncbi:hypothetical protein ACQPYE_28060 [Actinosynnema sp. CA-299493]